MSMQRTPMNSHRRQCGMALFLSLVFLLVLTLIGVSSMRGTTMEERMASNLRDKSLAIGAAEAALRAAEQRIESWDLPPGSGDDCGDSGCPLVWEPGVLNASNPDIWSDARTVTYAGFTNDDSLLADPPRYYVEQIADDSGLSPDETGNATVHYRITARGIGGGSDTRTMLQTTFARLY